MKETLQLLKAAGQAWSKDGASRLSAALAYYTVFSLAPLLIIAISTAGMIYGEEAAQGLVREQLTEAIGEPAAIAVEGMIDNANRSGNSGLMAIVGLVVLIFSATGVFAQLKVAMNIIWQIKPEPTSGILHFFKTRALALSMVLVIGFLLLISLILSTAAAALASWLETVVPVPGFLWQVLTFATSLALITLLFAMIFRILPDAHIQWKDVWTGAFTTACLFSLSKFALALYLGREGAASAYGAAGALMLLLLWVFVSSNILLFGAEITQALARSRGRRIEPKGKAVRIEPGTRA